MKNFTYLILILIISIFFSCEDIIDLKLPNNTPSLVIDANITNQPDHQVITISETINFSDQNNIKPVSSAKVTVQYEDGTIFNFFENAKGEYVSSPFKGISGKNYTLNVEVNNKKYMAKSKMPFPVKVDSLSQTELIIFGNKRKFVKIHYQDPINIPNYYLYRIFINGVRSKGYYVESDRFNDGKQISNSIFIDEPELKTGDTVVIDTRGITEKSYRYYFSISQITGNGGPPTTPANPDSNIEGGAFGFFNTSTSTIDTIIIK